MRTRKRPYHESGLHNYDMDHYGFHIAQYTDQEWPLPVASHYHYCIEAMFITSGTMEFDTENQHMEFNEGDLVFVGSNTVHSMGRKKNTKLEYFLLKFDQDLLLGHLESIFGFEYVTPLWESIKSIPLFWPNETIGDNAVNKIFNELYKESIGGTYGFEYVIRLKICELVLLLIRRNFHTNNQDLLGSYEDGNARVFLTKINSYITTHFYEELSAAQVAKYCDMSYSYFAKYFKRCSGVTFTEYYNKYRILKAESMIVSGQHNITKLAMEAGYSSASYFIKQFKRVKGTTPKQYIKQMLKSEKNV